MKYQIDHCDYDVVIEKKRNKNTYIRLKEPNIIYVTTSLLTTKRQALQLLDQNSQALIRMHEKHQRKQERLVNFYYLGQKYDIITVPTIRDVAIYDEKIYTPNEQQLEKWRKRQMLMLAKQHYEHCYHQMKENIPCFSLRIRKMKTRWGVCNRRSMTITLNYDLIQYPVECLDYVIIHELAHLTHFNHSKEFWQLVEKYCPQYKQIRKQLKG